MINKDTKVVIIGAISTFLAMSCISLWLQDIKISSFKALEKQPCIELPASEIGACIDGWFYSIKWLAVEVPLEGLLAVVIGFIVSHFVRCNMLLTTLKTGGLTSLLAILFLAPNYVPIVVSLLLMPVGGAIAIWVNKTKRSDNAI